MKKRRFVGFCYFILFLLIFLPVSVSGYMVVLEMRCFDIGRSNSTDYFEKSNVQGSDFSGVENRSVTIPKKYTCEGDYYRSYYVKHEPGGSFQQWDETFGPDLAYSVNYDAKRDDCLGYGHPYIGIDRPTVWDDDFGCCGDDIPGDRGIDLTDDPDSNEFFCEGNPFKEVDDWGCPIGRFSEFDPDAHPNNIDTNKRAWQFDLLSNLSGYSSLSCCGDDWGDEGLIFLDQARGAYRICDNDINGNMEWRLADANNIGGIYHINTSVDALNPENPGWDNTTADYYDVVGTEAGTWIACDTDDTLTSLYKPIGIFANFPFCEGGSGPHCLSAGDSEFICYDYAGRERIFECRDVATNARDFKARSSAEESSTIDEDTGFVIGKIIPNPFSDDFKEFNRIPISPCQSDFCLSFSGSAEEIPGADFSIILPLKPVIDDWTGYYALAFDIYFRYPQNKDKLEIRINDFRGNIEDYIVSSRGNWNHGVVPFTDISNLDSITYFSLYPLEFVGEVELNNFHLEGPNTFYCGREVPLGGAWRRDLDTDNTTIDTAHPTGGQACDAQLTMSWTGSKCCGDDYTTSNPGYQSEFYTDVEGNCWNSQYLSTAGQNYTIEDRNSILSFTDKFYSCFAPDYVKNIKSTVTDEILIEESDLCDVKGSYYCSYQGLEWSNLGYNNGVTDRTAGERTAAKFNPDRTSAECCHPSDCWNGSKCVASQEEITLGLPLGIEVGRVTVETAENYTGYRCINGEWIESEVKWDWLDQQWGYCSEESNCLLSSKMCVESGFFSLKKIIEGRDVSDLYCINGTWSTRTKKLAQTMLNIRNDNYVLDCGPYFQVLNYYSERTAFQPTLTFENIAAGPELNNLCVLSYDGNIVMGTTYNPEEGTELPYVLSNAFNIRDFSIANCQGDLSEDSFHDCGNGLWYNDYTKSIIYDPDDKIDLDGNFFTNIYDYLLGSIYGLFDIEIPITAGERALFFVNRTKLFNQLYVSKHGDKVIKAVVEKKYLPGVRPGVKQIFSATYEGFDTSICGSVLTYDWFVANKIPQALSRDIICEITDGKEVVVVIDDAVGVQAFNNLVTDMTRRTRTE